MKFFENYKVSVDGVPPENIYNFDEMNLKDDPGVKKCFFKKGTKYCEKVQNSSKQVQVDHEKTNENGPFMFPKSNSTVLVNNHVAQEIFS